MVGFIFEQIRNQLLVKCRLKFGYFVYSHQRGGITSEH